MFKTAGENSPCSVLAVLAWCTHESFVHVTYKRERAIIFHQFPLMNFFLICSFPLLLDFHMPEARPELPNAALVPAWLSVPDLRWWQEETEPAVTKHQQLDSKDVTFYLTSSLKLYDEAEGNLSVTWRSLLYNFKHLSCIFLASMWCWACTKCLEIVIIAVKAA